MNDITISHELLEQFLNASRNTNELLANKVIPQLGGIEVTVVDSNKTVHRIEEKVDTIIESLYSLQNDFLKLRKTDISEEEKLEVMSSKVERVSKTISQQEIEDFYLLCRSKYDDYWTDFDELTIKLLPVAEIFYVNLQQIPDADYSPVVLELCKAMENEWLAKIFRKYAADLVKRQGKNLYTFLTDDRTKYVKQTGKFAKALINSVNGPFFFTFGQMHYMINLLTDNEILEKSPLMKDFYSYLKKSVKLDRLVSEDYLEQVNEIVNKFRNPSAHSELMSLEIAKECREIFPDRLNYFEECVV